MHNTRHSFSVVKEKAFLDSIAQNIHDKSDGVGVAGESYKLRIVELEDDLSVAKRRATSLQERLHFLEMELKASNEHHTKQNANLQEKIEMLQSKGLTGGSRRSGSTTSIHTAGGPPVPPRASVTDRLRQRIQVCYVVLVPHK